MTGGEWACSNVPKDLRGLEMAHPLDGIDAKLLRASAHIGELDRQVRAFCDRRPYAVRVDKQADSQGRVVSVSFVAVDNRIGDPDLSIRLLAGEVVYQVCVGPIDLATRSNRRSQEEEGRPATVPNL